MSAPKHPSRTAAEWEESFALYNASSGLTQRQFCESHGISHSGFRHRYRRSPQFTGKRRRSSAEVAAGTPSAIPSTSASSSSFRPVRAAPAKPAPGSNATVVVRVHDSIAIECLTGADPGAVAALVRELVR